MEIEGRVQGKRLSIKYVAIYLVEIIYHLKKCLMFDLVSGTNWMGGEMRRVTRLLNWRVQMSREYLWIIF